ncbi:L-glyceraldehyde 3-phosphate reductase [Leeuwenhoekiella marinoflava]|uniref:L-glyceraldehyde 3-phosphate reductase n=2 Tax=Leeuwenhoekiella marinoflava TaxID=988 RepID=A0A4V1KSI7_9FLAO|nr:L-glyceraldehyde 3-phosphate reductase [Leeuwenhoekiella marinoflava]RXG31878.1 L-glyceraldehyde 3-phosphate reductase [Leeuwenhoekiella marinoflava]SHE90094.1 L-glyceraldehyde 3-phosphate reductase [Leeuwenhoekiella marinoflava DSM 3653]
MNIQEKFSADPNRYDTMHYRRCGNSGVKLPMIALGLWHNFGDAADLTNGRSILRKAFDKGITHFDLANNYGPPYGSAETNFGRIFKEDFKPYRDELFISSKAGYDMWLGPYGNFGSRKYLIASCDQSLKRMGLDYVDVFYHHRPDLETPLEETMGALDHLVRSGKALYVGISNYDAQRTRESAAILKDLGTPFLVHQPRYNMFDRWVEGGLLNALEDTGIGSVVFSPLQQGLLTNKYLKGIPQDSRAANSIYLSEDRITPEILNKVKKLNALAEERKQSLAQMAIAWLLKDKRVTSVLVGVSRLSQLQDNIDALNNLDFSEEELTTIETILQS